jgi:hypothetical protein
MHKAQNVWHERATGGWEIDLMCLRREHENRAGWRAWCKRQIRRRMRRRERQDCYDSLY